MVGIGVVLLLAFLIMGRGLSLGAFSTVVATGVNAVAPEHAEQRPPYAEYVGDGVTSPLKDWLVFEIIGVAIGGLISALLAGRWRAGVCG